MVARVRRRFAIAAFAVLFVSGCVAWGYDQRATELRLAERRRSDAVVCLFLNDTRAEMRGIIRDFTTGSSTALPPGLLPPELDAAIARSRADTAGRAASADARLADYDCDAFTRGALPSRTPTTR